MRNWLGISRFRLLFLMLVLPQAWQCQTISDHEVFGRYRQFWWNNENGLPRNTVTAIQQTRDGYLWIANPEGVARFDGVNFTFFDGKALKQDWSAIISLLEDHSGALWFAVRSHGLTRLKDGVFTAFHPAAPSGSYITEELFEDRAGTLWIATSGSGLLRFRDGQTSTLGMRDRVPGNKVTSIAQDPDGNLWIGTSAGLARMSGGTIRVFTKRDGLNDDNITALCMDRKGILWAGSAAGRIATFRNGKFVPYPREDEIPKSRIRRLYCDRDGRMWVGTDDKGVALLDQGHVLTYSSADGLPDDHITAIYQDADGAIWIGTYESGLVELRDATIQTYGIRGARKYGDIRAVIAGEDGSLWAGSEDAWYELKRNAFERLPWGTHLNDSTIAKDLTGAYWVTNGTDLARVQNDDLTNIAAHLFPDDRINVLYCDRRGQVWAGSRASGVCLFRNGSCTFYTTRQGLGHNYVVGFYEDRAGAIWVATLNGASRIQDGRITTWTTKDGLPSNVIACFYQTRTGSMWIGTQGRGLSRFKDGRFANVTTENGLFDGLAFQILQDDEENLWMSCNRGIYRAKLRELEDCAEGRRKTITSYSYGTADGMLTRECNGAFPAGWRSPDGRLWFGTTKGVVAVDPHRISNGRPPNVLIEQVSVEGRAGALTHEVHLAQRQHNLEIKYTVLKCDRPQQARFKVKLEGLDDDWKDAGLRRSALYSYLPPGTYTFRVIADNGEGIWNMAGDRLSISVASPYYRTWWFLALCALLVASITAAAWRARMAGLIRAREVQQQFLRQLIASQELERKRLAGELHDGLAQRLTMVKNFALMLRERASPASDDGNVSAIASETTEALREVREISYALRPYQLDYLGLKDAVRALIKKVEDSSETEFTCHLDDVDDLVPKESQIHLYRIVQECLNNIVKHAHAGRAEIRLARDGNRVRLEIRDDGVGFALGASRASSKEGGLGLTSISERVQLLGGKINVQSASGKGTRIAIELDTGRANLTAGHDHA